MGEQLPTHPHSSTTKIPASVCSERLVIKGNETCPKPPSQCPTWDCCPGICEFIYTNLYLTVCQRQKFVTAVGVWVFGFSAWAFSYFAAMPNAFEADGLVQFGLLVIGISTCILFFTAGQAARSVHEATRHGWMLLGFFLLLSACFVLPALGAIFGGLLVLPTPINPAFYTPVLLAVSLIGSVGVLLVPLALLAFSRTLHAKEVIEGEQSCCANRCPDIPCQRIVPFGAALLAFGVCLWYHGRIFASFLYNYQQSTNPPVFTRLYYLSLPLGILQLVVLAVAYADLFVCCTAETSRACSWIPIWAPLPTAFAVYWQSAAVVLTVVSSNTSKPYYEQLFLALGFLAVLASFQRGFGLRLSAAISASVAVLGRVANFSRLLLISPVASVYLNLALGFAAVVSFALLPLNGHGGDCHASSCPEIAMATLIAAVFGYLAVGLCNFVLAILDPQIDTATAVFRSLFIGLSVVTWIGARVAKCLSPKQQQPLTRSLLILTVMLVAGAFAQLSALLVLLMPRNRLDSSTILLLVGIVAGLAGVILGTAVRAVRCCRNFAGTLPSLGAAFTLYRLVIPLLAVAYNWAFVETVFASIYLPQFACAVGVVLVGLGLFWGCKSNCWCLRAGLEAAAVTASGAGICRSILFVPLREDSPSTTGQYAGVLTAGTVAVSLLGVALQAFTPKRYRCCEAAGAAAALAPWAFQWALMPTFVKALGEGVNSGSINPGLAAGILASAVLLVAAVVFLDLALVPACSPRGCKWSRSSCCSSLPGSGHSWITRSPLVWAETLPRDSRKHFPGSSSLSWLPCRPPSRDPSPSAPSSSSFSRCRRLS